MDFAQGLSRIGRWVFKRAKRGPAAPRDRGDAARSRQDWESAAREYRRHVDSRPADFAIWVQLGHMLKEAGKYRDASRAYLAAYRIDPENADLLLNIGHVAKLRGLSRSAALAYRQSYRIDPSADAARELSAAELKPVLPQIARRFAKYPSARSHDQMGPKRHQVGRIDDVDGWTVSGWAIDPDNPHIPAKISFFADGAFLCEAEACAFCFEIESMGYGSPLAGFQVELPIDLSGEDAVRVSARLSRTGEELSGSPFQISAPLNIKAWLGRAHRLTGDERAMVVARSNDITDGILSIIMPVYNTREDWLAEAVDSVIAQWCDRWELICVDDCSPDPRVSAQLSELARRNSRIKTLTLAANVGIAAATNAGIAIAQGAFVAFMDHDDYLEPDAVLRVLQATTTGADLIYSDEVITSENINVFRFVAARPSFSHDYYLSHPYFAHFNAARLTLVRQIGGWDEGMSISADVDFVYRMIEVSKSVAHVPAVLYRWRTHEGSAGHSAKDEVTPATLGALNRHLARLGTGGLATTGHRFNTFRVSFPDDGGGTLIIIPTKNAHELVAACLQSIWRTTDPADDIHVVIIDHESRDPQSIAFLRSLAGDSRISIVPYSGAFNYARMNNMAVNAVSDRFKYILFMNNDVEAIATGWLEHMRGLAGRPDVGVVGASLIYGNQTFQHSGVIMGLGDLVDHAHKFVPLMDGKRRNTGYNCSLISTRDYVAVTGACMMMRRALFMEVGGFDETLQIGFNDTDLCLRVGSLGYRILNDAFALLYHHESITRQKMGSMDHPEDYWRFKARWGHILAVGDPFYNHALEPRSAEDHRLAELTSSWVSPRVRRTKPTILPAHEGAPEAMQRLLRKRSARKEAVVTFDPSH